MTTTGLETACTKEVSGAYVSIGNVSIGNVSGTFDRRRPAKTHATTQARARARTQTACQTAGRRTEPVLLSDFTARPFLLDWCEPVRGLAVLDLGSGEGYVARHLKQRGAERLEGVDISPEMIKNAQAKEAEEQRGITYHAGDANDLSRFDDQSFDLVAAVSLFNYLTRDQSLATMSEVVRVLKPGGRFVFAVAHPSLPFLRPQEPPFYFAPGGAGYFSGRDHRFEGRIWRRDGKSVPVRCVHKTLEDYFACLHEAGFRRLPEIKELRATEEHLAFDADFFEALRDQPLHLAFRISKDNS